MKKKKENLLILDGFALIFRAFYAFIRNPLKTSTGKPSSAIFGFTKMLIKLLKIYKPDYFVVTLDTPAKTFRHEMYKEYKANRDEAPEELKIQIPEIIKLIQKLDIYTIQKDGYEADDIIGSICEKLKNEENLNIYICTGDKDILQLIEKNIKVINMAKGISEVKEYDRQKVKEKWLVYPKGIIPLLALTGDSSDNIPGVKGIGIKTAPKLLQKYNSIKEIYDNIDKIAPPTLQKKLIENKENAFLSKELVTIKRDLNLNYSLENLKTKNLNKNNAIEILKEYELFSIIEDDIFEKEKEKEIKEYNPTTENQSKGKYYYIKSKEEIKELLKRIKQEKLISIDLETNSKNPVDAQIIGFSIALKENEACYIPILHNIKNKIDETLALKELKNICEDSSIAKIGQNIKYDYTVLQKYDINLKNICFDTMIASYLLNPARKSHSMDALAMEMLNYKTIQYKEIVKDKQETLLDIDFDRVVNYAAEDADITLRLYKILKRKIDDSPMQKLFYNIELPLLEVLARMELSGISIDKNYFSELNQQLTKELQKLERNIYDSAEEIFNINSSQQLSKVLFDKLKLKPIRKTKTGYSTDINVLEKLKDKHEVPKYIVEYRKLSKLQSTYLKPLPLLVNSKTNRIHSSFNQAITHTGRLSSSNPNLQNIPIKGKLGQNIRKGFIAKDKHYILSADYSQIELRILAHFAKDEKLINAYKKNKDIHTQTASLIFNKKENGVTNKERQIAKTINFSVIYGIGARALAANLSVDSKDAKLFIDNYFREYSGIKEWIEKQKEQAYKSLSVESLFKRIRYIPELKEKNRQLISLGERLAVNTPIQATSADIIKLAMVNIDKEIIQKKLLSKLIIQVHDELVFEIPENEVDLMKSLVKENMENSTKIDVPLTVNIQYAKNWGDAHN